VSSNLNKTIGDFTKLKSANKTRPNTLDLEKK